MEALSAGRYRIARELGRGGMASVYLAHDEELGRDVAVKYLAEHLSGDDAFRARFVREARLAGRLAHPNIVRVYDVGANGELKNGRLFGKEEGAGGVPDGMRVDLDGNVYVTGPGGIWLWDPNGTRVYTIGGDKTIRVWDARDGKQLRSVAVDENYPRQFAFTPDFRRCLVPAPDSPTTDKITVYDTASWKVERVIAFAKSRKHAGDAFGPGHHRVAQRLDRRRRQ